MTSVSAVSSEQFASLLAQRRSVRDFSETSITLPQLLSVVAAGQGITGPEGLRATPSAHRLFPLVLRIVVRRVQGLEQGLYDYFPETNELVSVATLPAEGAMLDASLASDFWLEDAACVVVVCANLSKALAHFSEQDDAHQRRGQRYVDFEAGAASQNMHLQAITAGLGAIVVMGIDEAALKQCLMVPDDLEVVSALCVGHSALTEGA